jgi:DNA-binding transcriptional LysR family regulator
VNTDRTPDAALDIRALRSFVAVADELHFTRAANRLFVAQQALSRDIRKLEAQLGVQLFVRTTRRVTLTPEGAQFLGRARELLRLHDQAIAEIRQPRRAVLVDLMSEGRQTGLSVLEAARQLAPSVEFRGRYGGAMGLSFRRLQAAELDVALGRARWRGQRDDGGIEREVVRYEPLALLLPATHPLAAMDAVPVAALRGQEIDANPAHPDAFEWIDLSSQLLELAGAVATPEHDAATGLDDQAHHLIQQNLPILTAIDHVPVPGGVVRPIVDPVPIYCWSIAWRAGAHPAGLAALRESATRLREERRWLELPDGAWLPEPEASTIAERPSA